MAERRRPSKSRGKANTRNNKKVNKAVDKKRFGDTIYDEIILLTLMILSLIVMVSLFTSVMGVFGQVVSSFLKGLFGAGAIVLPIILIAFCVWVILNREHRFFVAKAIGVGMFTISISIMFHLITEGGTVGENSFFTQAKEFYTNGSGINGGLIGGFLAYWLYTGIGWGSYIVAFALVIISIMLGTGKSLFVGIGILIDIIDEKYQGVKETREKNREFEEELYEDEEKKAFYLQKREEQYYAKLEKRENRKGLVNILLGDNTGKNPVKEFSEFEEEKAVIRPKVEEPKREEPKIIEKPREHKMIDILDIDLSPTKEKLIEVIGSTTRFEDEPIQIFGLMDEEVPQIEGELQLEDTSFKNPFLKKETTKNDMPPVLQVIKPPVREEVKEEIKEPIKEPIFQPIKTPEIMQDPIIEPLPKEEELIINIANEEPEPIEEFSQELEEEIFAPMETIEPEEIEEIVEIEEVATPEEVVAPATVKEELVENLAIVKKQEEIEEDKYIFPPID
ncbi:MAG: DNA translocase FtsK 4TM domain-containing protein, partial [Anaerotignaceae bacterium]